MSRITTIGEFVFTHTDGYGGLVTIQRGGEQMAVPYDVLRQFTADFIRHERLAQGKSDAPDCELLLG